MSELENKTSARDEDKVINNNDKPENNDAEEEEEEQEDNQRRRTSRTSSRSSNTRGGGRRRRRRGCPFRDKNGKCQIDYKDVETLRHYLTDTGKIRPRRQTSACAKCQRALAVAIKRARHLALLPYAPQHSRRR